MTGNAILCYLYHRHSCINKYYVLDEVITLAESTSPFSDSSLWQNRISEIGETKTAIPWAVPWSDFSTRHSCAVLCSPLSQSIWLTLYHSFPDKTYIACDRFPFIHLVSKQVTTCYN